MSLFSGAGIRQLNTSSLTEFKKVMIASLLEHLEQVMTDYGVDNILVQTMYKSAELHGISLAQLKHWGAKIKKERAILNGQRNKTLTSFSEECFRALAASRTQIKDLKDHILELEKKDEETNKKLEKTNQRLEEIITLLQTTAFGGREARDTGSTGSTG